MKTQETTHRARRVEELARREANGITVALRWHRSTNAVTVVVSDVRSGDRFRLQVAPHEALDAFYHPFAYPTACRSSREPIALTHD